MSNPFFKNTGPYEINDLLKLINLDNQSIKILFQKDKIIFGDDSLDITKEILEIFNKKHKNVKFE